MMWRKSLSLPGLAGFPPASHASRDCPPFQARVVKPRISTLTPQRSSVRAKISAQVAATVIGRPRIEPELSISSVTTVSRNAVSFSRLNESGCRESTMMRGSLAGSRMPSSRSNSQDRLCCVAFALFGIGVVGAFVNHIERYQQLADGKREGPLILDLPPNPVEISGGAFLHPWAPEIDDPLRILGRPEPS